MKKLIITEHQAKLLFENDNRNEQIGKLINMFYSDPSNVDTVNTIANSLGLEHLLFSEIWKDTKHLVYKSKSKHLIDDITNYKNIKYIAKVMENFTTFKLTPEDLKEDNSALALLTGLKNLVLRKFGSIPQDILKIKVNHTIFFEECRLSNLIVSDKVIGLEFKDSDFSSVSDQIHKMANVKALQIVDDYNLTEFGGNIRHPNVVMLNIRRCNLFEFDHNVLKNFPHLNTLYISGSKIPKSYELERFIKQEYNIQCSIQGK